MLDVSFDHTGGNARVTAGFSFMSQGHEELGLEFPIYGEVDVTVEWGAWVNVLHTYIMPFVGMFVKSFFEVFLDNVGSNEIEEQNFPYPSIFSFQYGHTNLTH